MIDPTNTDAEGMPPSLKVLSEDLQAPGPALPLSALDAERLIAGALKAPQRRAVALGLGSTVRKKRAMGAVALVLLGSSAAAAWYQHRVSVRERAKVEAFADQQPSERDSQRTGSSPTPPNPTPVSPTPGSEGVTDGVLAHEQSADTVAPTVEPALRPAPAEDLLQKASRLRRDGQPKEAEQVYLQLVQREPQSTSAYVARVAVAELRIGRSPASAIELLQAALRHFPQGPLDIEIHQLLAQGYRSTGNATLERNALTRLTTRHPGSLAADRARTRLNELGDK
jgi:TolA-binding protein